MSSRLLPPSAPAGARILLSLLVVGCTGATQGTARADDATTLPATAASAALEQVPGQSAARNPFGLPAYPRRDPFDFSHQKHCDVLRHLKVPATPRRLDAYMRPEYMLPRGEAHRMATRDQLIAGERRDSWFSRGIDIYGCSSLDYLRDLESNLSSQPLIAGPGPWHDWQLNINQVLGVDVYSRLASKTWTGGQIHLSFTWPRAGNEGPIYSYGNTLNPAGLGTRQYHGYFYTDVGRSREENRQMQGARLFEYWFQQAYGYKNQSYVRVGAINPWITFNKSILSGMFGFWTFDEPGVIGTTPGTANGPLIVVAPPGVSVEHATGDHLVFKGMVASGYWDPTGGIDNKRGFKQYWDLERYGLEYTYEVTYRRGTYSLNPADNGRPWFVRAGGQYHSGIGLDNAFDIDGNYFFLTGRPRLEYRGNQQYYAMAEGMLYRKPGSYSQGLTAFLKVKWSPYEYRGSTTKPITFGIGYEGVLGRAKDVLFAGYSHMRVNQGVIERSLNQRVCTEVPGCSVSGFQGVYEVGYSAQLTKYLYLNPKLFYVRYPNVRRDLGDLFSFGVELRASI